MSELCECVWVWKWIANAVSHQMRIYASNTTRTTKAIATDFIAVSSSDGWYNKNIMQLSYIMTLDLKQLQQSWRFTKIPDIKIFYTACTVSIISLSLTLLSFSIFCDATERSCFIHNNSCYCVRPPLCVYCFGLVLSVASMWRTDESLELCVCCSLCGNSLWNACLSMAIWSFALVPFPECNLHHFAIANAEQLRPLFRVRKKYLNIFIPDIKSNRRKYFSLDHT